MEFVLLKRSEFGCVFFLGGGGGDPNPDFRIQKRSLRFFLANQKTDHESIKSKL